MLLRCSRFHSFGDFSAANFAAEHWIPLSNTLNIRILQWIPQNTAVDSTERCSGLHRWPQWTPPIAAVESTISCSGLHCSVLVEFTELFHLIISTAVFSGIHWIISLNYFTELFHWIISPNYFTELFQYQLTKTINHRKKVEFMYFSALSSRVQFWKWETFSESASVTKRRIQNFCCTLARYVSGIQNRQQRNPMKISEIHV